MNTKHDHGSGVKTDNSDAHFHAALAWFAALSVSIATIALS
jgi:hypothetical protein